jgi:glutamate racemase
VQRYALEAAEFLLQKRVKMLVVACNTAASVALTELEKHFSLPVVGVIEPGAAKAVALTVTRTVGVIGTEGTIKSGAYVRAIHAHDPAIRVRTAACPLFVPLAEEGWAEHPVARTVAEEYLSPLLEQGIDSLVLGCTHYPLLKRTLNAVLGDRVHLVDSAEETARRVGAILSERGLRRQGPPFSPRFFVTDVPTRFERVGGSFLGAPLHCVEQVTID